MGLADKIYEIRGLENPEKEALELELRGVMERFGPNLIEACVHGSSVTGYHCPKGRGLTYKDFPDGFEKLSKGGLASDVDILFIVREIPCDDPISGRGIYRPLKLESVSSEKLPWRPQPDEYPRLSYSFPDENGIRHLEEHYRFVQDFGDFKVDWNVVSERQYELWGNKIPEWAKVILCKIL